MAQKWEYRDEYCTTAHWKDLMSTLDKLGEEGWEAVNLVQELDFDTSDRTLWNKGYTVLLKRLKA